jgi:hypothetical protein
MTQGIDFADRFFWAYDVAVGVFLKHLINEAQASREANTPWLSEAVSHWHRQAAIAEFGLTLEENWTSLQRQTFIELATKACEKLAMRESIPADEIEAWSFGDDLRIFFHAAQRKFSRRLLLNWAVRSLQSFPGTYLQLRKMRFGSMGHLLAGQRYQ